MQMLQMLLYLNMRYMTETGFFWKQSVQLGELVLCKHTVSKIKSWIFHEINVPPFSNLCLCNSATPPQYDNLFFEFTWDDSLELQQSQVQVWVRMGGLYCSCLYQCVIACCVSLCVCVCVSQAALEKALSCVALEAPSWAGWPASPQTCCLDPVQSQGLTIVLLPTPFVLFSLATPIACHLTPPPLSSCLLPCRCSWSVAQRRRKLRPGNNSRLLLLFI